MNKITIIKTTKSAGYYVFHLSNDHSLIISHCPELREWHLFGNDDADRNYEPVHPFHDTLAEAKSYIPEAIENIEKAERRKSEVKITNEEKTNGYHRIELSNGHEIRIMDMKYNGLQYEWHIFGYDTKESDYREVCHPFHSSWRDCKSMIPSILDAWNKLENRNDFPYVD